MSNQRPDVVVRGSQPQPRVSVIMPVYNAGATMRSAVHTALGQSLSDLEVLIVDDGSTDCSLDIATTLARDDGRISVLKLPHNMGQAAARNAAIDESRGKWIAPLDADDEMSEHRLKLLCELAESEHADFVADTVDFVDPCEPVPLHRPCSLESTSCELLSLEAIIESDIPLNGMCSYGYLKPIMRRDFLRRWKMRYDPDLRFAEDLNLYLQGLAHGARFVLHPEAHYFYKQTPVSASRGVKMLPSTASHALVNNTRVQLMLQDRQIRGLERLLNKHRRRWELVLWFNQVKQAMRYGRAGDALRLSLEVPSGPGALVRFARDRWNHKRADSGPGHVATIRHNSSNSAATPPHLASDLADPSRLKSRKGIVQ